MAVKHEILIHFGWNCLAALQYKPDKIFESA
jgi:hypothetical protein